MLALLLRGIQMGDVKDLVMAVKFGISGFYGNINEGWDESSVVHRIPTD